MRVHVFSCLVAVSCGRVAFSPTPDAASPDSASPDSAPDGNGKGCEVRVAAPPMWYDQRGFTLIDDPTRTHPLVWVSNDAAHSGSFTASFQDNDRITGLTIETYGNGQAALRNIRVAYQPSASANWQTLATGEDVGHTAVWASVTLPSFQPAILAAQGQILVSFDVSGAGYCIATVTPVLERNCK